MPAKSVHSSSDVLCNIQLRFLPLDKIQLHNTCNSHFQWLTTDKNSFPIIISESLLSTFLRNIFLPFRPKDSSCRIMRCNSFITRYHLSLHNTKQKDSARFLLPSIVHCYAIQQNMLIDALCQSKMGPESSATRPDMYKGCFLRRRTYCHSIEYMQNKGAVQRLVSLAFDQVTQCIAYNSATFSQNEQ